VDGCPVARGWLYSKTNGCSIIVGLVACETNGCSTISVARFIKQMLDLLFDRIYKTNSI